MKKIHLFMMYSNFQASILRCANRLVGLRRVVFSKRIHFVFVMSFIHLSHLGNHIWPQIELIPDLDHLKSIYFAC